MVFIVLFLIYLCYMATKKKQAGKRSAKSQKPPVISNDVGNYEKHPFFVKKVNAAKEFLAHAGVPKQFVKKQA